MLNKEKESGVLHYQNLVRKMVIEKWKEEESERNALTEVGSRGSASGLVGGEEVKAEA